MLERTERILKIICIGLGVLLLCQLIKVGIHFNPLARLVIPDLPSLPADTNAPPKDASIGPVKPGTNSTAPPTVSKTNSPVAAADTNAATVKIVTGTNAPDDGLSKTNDTNSVVAKMTNPAPSLTTSTNNSGTNASIAAISDTNTATTKLESINKVGNTNAAVAKVSVPQTPNIMPPSMAGMMPGKKPASLLPEIQARVDRITDSEILGPVIRPMPMALIGIAGDVAFLRTPSGQTGLVKEGDALGEIKLLRIGINRVLIEQDGQKKELTMFSGFGGDSLLPKPTDTPDETTKK